jgi:hypothetical protein
VTQVEPAGIDRDRVKDGGALTLGKRGDALPLMQDGIYDETIDVFALRGRVWKPLA